MSGLIVNNGGLGVSGRGFATGHGGGGCCCGSVTPDGCDEGPYPPACGTWSIGPTPPDRFPCWSGGVSSDQVGTFTVQFRASRTTHEHNTNSGVEILTQKHVFYRGTFGFREDGPLCNIQCLRFIGSFSDYVARLHTGEVFRDESGYSNDCADADEPWLISTSWRNTQAPIAFGRGPFFSLGSSTNPMRALGEGVELGIENVPGVFVPGWGEPWIDSYGCSNMQQVYDDPDSGRYAEHEARVLSAQPYQWSGGYDWRYTRFGVSSSVGWSLNYSARFWDDTGARIV